MPYIKQYPIMTNTPAVPAEVTENFEDARRYVNQEVVAADINDDSIDWPEIVKGELTTFTGPEHQFTTGPGYGIYKHGITKWTGITNTSKQEYLPVVNQITDIPIIDPRNVTQIVTIPDSGKEITLEHRALVTYKCFLDVHIMKSVIPDADNTALFPEHRGTTKFWLSTDGGKTYDTDTTEGRFYDETAYSAPAATSSWAGPIVDDPCRDLITPDGFANNIYGMTYRRQYVMCKAFILDPGEHQVCVVADVHHEWGVVQSQNVSIECEYIGTGIV